MWLSTLFELILVACLSQVPASDPAESRLAVEAQTTSSVNYAASLLRQAAVW
jgi:hypothetical protein